MSKDRRANILIIDDEPNVVGGVQDLLRFDYRVLSATRAKEAIRILEQEPIDVVMTDQRMPEMTGVELLHHVRTTHPDVVRLLFTGYSDMRAVIDAVNRGSIYRYITKPWDPDELLSVIRDAVEHHDLLAERERLLAELQSQNERLVQVNAELAEVSDLKSKFIDVASHELRTPLAILVPLAHMMELAPDVQDPMRRWVHNVSSATERLRQSVDQLTTMLALKRFEWPLERRLTSIGSLLQEAADDVRPFVEIRRQTLVCDFEDPLGTIDVDGLKIRDSVVNILLNAVKFTPDEGLITLAAHRTADGGAEISVSDTGVGIDGRSLRRIFEPFFTQFDISHHASGSFQYASRGMGLGLSIAKGFVEMHGGRVEARSEVGRGSTFTLTLPGRAGDARAAGAGGEMSS